MSKASVKTQAPLKICTAQVSRVFCINYDSVSFIRPFPTALSPSLSIFYRLPFLTLTSFFYPLSPQCWAWSTGQPVCLLIIIVIGFVFPLVFLPQSVIYSFCFSVHCIELHYLNFIILHYPVIAVSFFICDHEMHVLSIMQITKRDQNGFFFLNVLTVILLTLR